jgi:hypothetical protein
MSRVGRLVPACLVALALAPPPKGATREHRVPAAPPLRAGDDASLATTTRVPYAPETLAPPAPPARNAAVDRTGAASVFVPREDMPTFSVFVEGSRGERRAQPLSLEQRFAATLGGDTPTLASRLAGNNVDAQPCPKLSSPGTPFGPAYNPFMFCP